MQNSIISFIGAGNMAISLIQGLLKKKLSYQKHMGNEY